MKSKYDPNYHPIMAAGYAMDGLIDEEIAGKLGIATSTLYEWKKKYPEFSESIKKSKKVVDYQAEQRLFSRVMGYDYEEVQTEILAIKTITKDGETIEQHPIKIKKIKKHIPPDVAACFIWLKNRKKNKWRDNPDFNTDYTRNPLQKAEDSLQNDD
ncbi:MAG TPA: hypothetical protein DDX14_02980, partial [Cyanobacteria bacterium UBA9579]|nr:hypothetical protein [Cyanobacteria bacterium UBA9579]